MVMRQPCRMLLSFLSEVMNFLLGENKFCPEEIKNEDAETRSF